MSSRLAKFHKALAAAGVTPTAVASDDALAHELAQALRWKGSMSTKGAALVAHVKKTAEKPDFDAEKYAQFLAKTWVKPAALAYYDGSQAQVDRYVDKNVALEAGRIFVEYALNGEFDDKSATASVASSISPLEELAVALAFSGVNHTVSIPKPIDVATASVTRRDSLKDLALALASSGVPHVFVGDSAGANAEKRIRVSYEVWDDESIEAGDTDEKGWENEEGIDFTTDEDPVAEAARYLKSEGATEFSSSHFDARGWYQSSDEGGNSRNNIESGEVTNRHFHLNEGWTDAEKEAIYNAVTGKTATAGLNPLQAHNISHGLKILPVAYLKRMSPDALSSYKDAIENTRNCLPQNAPSWQTQQLENTLKKIEALRSGASEEQAEWADEKPHSGSPEDRTATAAQYADLGSAVKEKIAAGEPFRAGAGKLMTGGTGVRLSGSPEFKGAGRASEAALTAIDKARADGASYWIYSYDTPIAVRIGSTFFMLPGKYSPTTSRQQSSVALSLNARQWGADEAPTAAPAPKTAPEIPGGLDLG